MKTKRIHTCEAFPSCPCRRNTSCRLQSLSLPDRSSHRSHWASWAPGQNPVPRQVLGLRNCLTRHQGSRPNPWNHRFIQKFKNFNESTWLYWCSKGVWWGRGRETWKNKKTSGFAADDKNIFFVQRNLHQCIQKLWDDLNTSEGLPTYSWAFRQFI